MRREVELLARGEPDFRAVSTSTVCCACRRTRPDQDSPQATLLLWRQSNPPPPRRLSLPPHPTPTSPVGLADVLSACRLLWNQVWACQGKNRFSCWMAREGLALRCTEPRGLALVSCKFLAQEVSALRTQPGPFSSAAHRGRQSLPSLPPCAPYKWVGRVGCLWCPAPVLALAWGKGFREGLLFFLQP